MASEDHFVWKLASDLSKEDVDDLGDEMDVIRANPNQAIYKKMKEKYPELTVQIYITTGHYVLEETPEEKEEIRNEILEMFNVPGPVDADEDEEQEEDDMVNTNILRFKFGAGKAFNDPVVLDDIYSSIILDGNVILSKTYHGHPPEYISEGISPERTKAINNFIYSEHVTRGEKKEKVFLQNIITCLYYANEFIINCIVSDTGFLSFRVEPKKMNTSNSEKILEKVKEAIQLFYNKLTGKKLEAQISFNDIDVKIIYSTKTGYIPKKTVADAENVEIVNERVKFTVNDMSIWYSANDSKMNYTVSGLDTMDNVDGASDAVAKRYAWYEDNVLRITGVTEITTGVENYIDGVKHRRISVSTSKPHNIDIKKKTFAKISGTDFDGKYLIKSIGNSNFMIDVDVEIPATKLGKYILSSVEGKQSIKTLRAAGLVVNSKECEKKRRPELLQKGDTSTGDNILIIKGRKFKCNPPYNYHGTTNKVNCCYKQQPRTQASASVPIQVKLKKTPYKKYDKMVKFSTKTMEGSVNDHLSSEYMLLGVANEVMDRTVVNCLKIAYNDQVVEEAVAELQQEDYTRYYTGNSIGEWRSIEPKSIGDIVMSVALYKKVNILLLADTANELTVDCNTVLNFDTYLVIYRSTQKEDAYYPIVKIENGTPLYVHQEMNIKNLVDLTRNSCKTDSEETPTVYSSILVKQVTDIQGIVVFIEVNTGGYIPVTPSTLDTSKPSISVSDNQFKMLTPEAQYNSLVKLSKNYPSLTPTGLTKVYESDIITGIKLRNGGISPVTHTTWPSSPIPMVDDLFYIERYSAEADTFEDEEDRFKNNIKKYANSGIDIVQYIETDNYPKIIEMLQPLGLSPDDLSRLVWYLINN